MPGTIAVVYRHYAHEKAARLLVRTLADGSGQPVSWSGLSAYDDNAEALRSLLEGAEVVVLSCGGRDISRILNLFPESRPRPFFISLFPGIVLRSQLDAFITRLRCDLVLLNSRADLASYGRICDLLQVPFNGILYGAGWFEAPADALTSTEPTTVFFEQINVPHRTQERRGLAEGLARLALRYPRRQFLIKVRGPAEIADSRLLRHGSHSQDRVSDFIARQRPLSNLHITDAPVSQLLGTADSCVTISSSAAIEALLAGRRTYLLADYPARRNFGEFFHGSGLSVRLSDLDLDRYLPPGNEWLLDNVMDPRVTLPEILRAVSRMQKNPRPLIAVWRKVLLAVSCGSASFPEPHSFLHRTFKAFRLIEARVE